VRLDLGDGVGVAVVDPRTRALVEDVPNLLGRLARLRDQAQASRVRQAIHDELYVGLPGVDDEVMSELLHLVVALLRAADARDPGSPGANANLFAQLRRDYTEPARIYVHGMARAHEPDHGQTWSDDVGHWFAALEANLRPAPRPDPATPPAPTPTPRAEATGPAARARVEGEDDGDDEDEDVSLKWPARFGWTNRHVEFLGARQNRELLASLRELTGSGRLRWTPLSRDDPNMRRVQALATRIESGGVDLVVVFSSFASHKATSLIKQSLRKSPRVKVLWTSKLPSLANLIAELSEHPEAHLEP
jgi:hypothetical protein